MSITFEVLTLFPGAVEAFVETGLLGKAMDKGLVCVHATDIRDFATDKHRTVDDAPFGGGAGMVLKAEPIVAALEAVEAARGPAHRILLTPSAPRFDQRVAERLATLPRIALVCGRYEGVDDRVREHFTHEAISLGDFILGGGEVAALAVIEAVARLEAGVLGNPGSITQESFADAGGGPWLEYPQYTRPAQFRGHRVPDVLLGGNHAAVERWRAEAARRRTHAIRPDLRGRRALAPTHPVHIAVPGDTAPAPFPAPPTPDAPESPDSIVLLGADAEATARWAQAAGSGVQVVGFRDLAALCRRLRQRSGLTPWVVAIVASATTEGPATRASGTSEGPATRADGMSEGPATGRASEVLDALPEPAAPDRALVLWVAPRGAELGVADAVFAPPLALGAAIVDASRPSSPEVELAARALSLLREAP